MLAARAAHRRRALTRRRLRTANTDVRVVLLERLPRDPDLGSLRVGTALGELPGLGAVSVKRLLRDLGIDPKRRLRSLGTHEVNRIVSRLDAT